MCAAVSMQAPSTAPPNIIFNVRHAFKCCRSHLLTNTLLLLLQLVDDWGSYDASYRMKQLGRPVDIPTPHIDALHDAGIGFLNYYVQPICSPTRSVLLSGRYSCRDGVENKLFGTLEAACLPTEREILPQVLKRLYPQHNYAAHMIGKWHL